MRHESKVAVALVRTSVISMAAAAAPAGPVKAAAAGSYGSTQPGGGLVACPRAPHPAFAPRVS